MPLSENASSTASSEAYNRVLLSARRQYLSDGGPRAAALRRLETLYAEMIEDLAADVDAGEITLEREEAMREDIARRLARIEDDMAALVEDAQREAIRATTEAHEDAVRAAGRAAGLTPAELQRILYGANGPALETAFERVPDQTLRLLATRRGVRASVAADIESMRTIISRGLLSRAAEIGQVIASGIGRGVSHQRLTDRLVAAFGSGSKSEGGEVMRAVLEGRGPAGRQAAEALERGRQPAPDGAADLDPDALKQTQRVLFDARRIAVSEINNAYAEADVVGAVQSPIVRLLRWRTSVRHDSLSCSPDVCDVLERADLGYGPGLYHPRSCPPLSHPFCMCRREAVLFPPDQWEALASENPPDVSLLEPETLEPEEIRGILANAPGRRRLTPEYVQSQTRLFNSRLALGWEYRLDDGPGIGPGGAVRPARVAT